MQKPFIVCDPEKCTGCQMCEFACSARHGGYNPLASSHPAGAGAAGAHHAGIACRLCDEPTCMAACPRQCISVSQTTGIMLVDKDVCNGCGWCVEACEFGAVTINHGERIVSMCNLCEDRDDRPRCVEICVHDALSLSTPAEVSTAPPPRDRAIGRPAGNAARAEGAAMKRMLLGNEALSLGAYMAGVTIATGYPGTPSTEILEVRSRRCPVRAVSGRSTRRSPSRSAPARPGPAPGFWSR